ASWVDRHGDVLFRYALARVGQRSVAEELVQETFLAALQARDSFAGQSSERTWLIAILRHRLGDHFRRLSREAIGQLDDVDATLGELFTQHGKWRCAPADWGDPRRAFEQSEFWNVFERCMAGLPARLSAAFGLRDVDRLESDEVCKILDVSPTNLWTLL